MNVWVVIPLVSFISYSALLLITLRRPGNRVRRIFALYLAMTLAWSFGSFAAHTIFPLGGTLLWSNILNMAGISMMVPYYHFVCAFTNKRGGVVVPLGYILVAILSILSALGYVIRAAYVSDGLLFWERGPLFYPLWAFTAIYTILSWHSLIQRRRKLTDPVAINRVTYLLIGLGMVVLFGSSNMAVPLSKYPIDHIGSLANALLVSYAIFRYQMLEITLVLRKGLVYSGLTIFLTSLYLLLLSVIYTTFHSLLGYASVGLAAILALLVAIVFVPLRNITQYWVDRLFYRDTYNYRRMMLDFSSKMSNVLDLQELSEGVLQTVIKGMRVRQAALLLPEVESDDFRTAFFKQDSFNEPLGQLRLRNDSPLTFWLGHEGKTLRREVIDILPQFQGLWRVEREELDSAEIELLCPIMSKGSLIGILALGKKKSDSPYLDEEVELLMTMASGTAIVIENARMLDSLKKQRLRMEQLLAQMVMAQEEERKRVSVELHDTIAQWLVSASYRVQTCNSLLSSNDNGEVRSELVVIENIVDKCLKELRRLMVGLRPPILDELGLTQALRQALDELRAEGVTCHFKTLGAPIRLPSDVEIAIYRIVQEALTNVRKHAEASEVDLKLHFGERDLLVEVRDNGKGFDLAQTLNTPVSIGHMGLLGMKQRVEMLGGMLRVNTSKGAGAHILLLLPIKE